MNLEDKMKLNKLFDIYGELLTVKQREYYEYYYLKDYSLSEISEYLEVSRNAVHVQLKNVIKHLENYEDKLMVLKKKDLAAKISRKIENNDISFEDIKKELEKV
ncbi:MAG: hypothetical protein KAU02_01050 [Tenericutes bacterium]|nr:hypothetical protein [Mycoplasmatota bacterium]